MSDGGDVNERLARIEASLVHVVKAVDRAQETRDDYLVRLSRLEEKIGRLEQEMPAIEKNTITNAKQAAKFDFKEQEKEDNRSARAYIVSIVALFISSVSVIIKWLIDA